jgi:hypothetical protein
MKNILESEKTFEAYATIDLCYYGLQKLNEELGQPKSGLEILIDRSTGFDKAKMKEWIETSIELLEQIIEAKKVIEADYKNDSKMLDDIRALA